MPLLDSVRDEFANRNALLHLLLGAISMGRRLDALLPGAPAMSEPSAGAPEKRRLPPPDGAPHGTSAGDPRGASDQLLYLVLGAISLRRALMAELEPLHAAHAAAVRQGAAGAQDPAGQAATLRDLLR
ncbi:hypothetical protein [Sorangium atrum]|uniref:Uncharacterized protein n=1 Tax=Sorangium atrum TaxID=2995308 RepID=A0ABT5CI33_9BACT|nr:hypothetical protein [Sorangium aterium]MDC0683645.1 hypothetical protein [Sorangium aterium]MDC0684787.1 hypothetical protein [Sorangium aterium]